MVFLSRLAIFFIVLNCSAFSKSMLGQSVPKDSLVITSWNLHLLPSPVFFRTKKKKRTQLIIRYFNENRENDLLLFQEVFHSKRRKQLINHLSKVYPYHTPIVNSARGKLFKTNSGLLIFSKTPFSIEGVVKFNQCSGSDCMAYKGAQMINTKINNKTISIINTHLNSEPPRSIALDQMQMIQDSLAKSAYYKTPYVFIGGDFNINISDSVNYRKMTKVFKTKNKRHYDITKISSGEKKVKNTLDYIFLYNSIKSEIKLTSYKYLIGPEWDKDDSKKVYGKTVGLSDHYPVQSILIFED